jgi:GGDEF domain-containing protein
VRPVADLPLEGLTASADELAKAWAVALILARPPSAIAEIPLEELARDGPLVCAQLLHALQSDAELERLTGPGEGGREEGGVARRLGALTGAEDAASVVAAVEALRGVLWDALLGELRRPLLDRADRQMLSDLADRLAHVCAAVLAAALPSTTRGGRIGGDDGVLIAGTGGPRPGPREPVAPAGPGSRGRGEVVIIDERQSATAPSSARVVVARGASAASEAEHGGEPAPSWTPSAGPTPSAALWGSRSGAAAAPDAGSPRSSRPAASQPEPEPPHETDEAHGAAPPAQEVEIQIRDERIEEGPAAWIRSIGRELDRFAIEGRPFAVLLIELMDAASLKRSEPPEEVMRLAGQVQRTLESELWSLSERAGASLTREAPGRFWLLAPGIEALRVRALAEQIEHAVRRSVSHHGEPVEIAVGTAVCPADGMQAAALAAHADVALYAARSAGSAGDGAAG